MEKLCLNLKYENKRLGFVYIGAMNGLLAYVLMDFVVFWVVLNYKLHVSFS